MIFEGNIVKDTARMTLQELGVHEGNTVHVVLKQQSEPAMRPPQVSSTEDHHHSKLSSIDVFSQSIVEFVGNSTWEIKGFSKGNVLIDKTEIRHGVNIEDCKETVVRIPEKVNHILINR